MIHPVRVLATLALLSHLFLSAGGALAAEDKQKSPEKRGFIENLFLFPFEATQSTEKLLTENVFGLGEVKISNARVASRLSDEIATDVPHNITLIGEREMQESGVSSTSELLSRKEGVTYTDLNGQGLGANVELRGFGGEGKQALVIFDGVRATEPFDNSTTWSMYPHEYLERIEIERGGGSTVYGEGALSGVVRMKTKSPTKDWRFSTENAWGSFDTERYFGDVSGTVGNVGIYAGARYLSTDGYRVNSGHEGNNMLLKTEIALTDRLRAGNTFYYADQRTDIPGPLSQLESDLNRRQQDPDGQLGDQFSDQLVQDGLSVAYVNEELGLELTDLFTYRKRNQDSVQSFGGFFPGTNFSDIETYSYANVIQGAWSFEKGDWKSRATIGLEWSRDDIFNPSEFISPFGRFPFVGAVDREMMGYFAQEHVTLWDKIIFQAGVRYDDIQYEVDRQSVPEIDRTASSVSPGVGVEYKIVEALSVYGSYAETFKGPDVTALITEAPSLFTPNPGVDPQIAKHHEIGVRYAHPVFGSIRADVFYIETKKEILFNATNFQSENFDTTRSGFEFGEEIALTPWLDVFANYVYTNAEFDHGPFDGKTVPLTPESRWNAGFTAEPIKFLRVSFYGTGVYDQFALNNFQNTVRADDYWTLGGRVEYKPGAWSVFLNAQNILDEEYSTIVTTNGAGTLVNVNPMPKSSIEGGFRIEL